MAAIRTGRRMDLPINPARPALLIDVDGVISLFPVHPNTCPPGTWVMVDGIIHLLSTEAAEHLRELGRRFDLVWCTGWEEKADEYIPRALGLPRGLPHVCFGGQRPEDEAHWKLGGIDRQLGPERALAWIDDAHDEACAHWAQARHAPTLLLTTESRFGLTRAHADRLIAWADGLHHARAHAAAGTRRPPRRPNS